MKSSSIRKVSQSELYLEYEFRDGSEIAGRYFLFFSFLFLFILTFLGVINLFNRGLKNNNFMIEFSTPINLLFIIGPSIFFLAMVIVSTKAYRNPFLIVLDAEAQLVKYRTFFTIRLKEMPLSKLKSFTCATYERSRNMLSGYQEDKIIGNGRIFFNGSSFINRIRIEDLTRIALKEWIIFLEDMNRFISVNFGPENNFRDQIDTFNSSQGRTRIDVKFNCSKHKG